MLKRMLRYTALNHGRLRSFWVRLCRPRSNEYALYMKRFGGLFAMGEGCHINPGTTFTDPSYVRLGDNVALSICTLIGHDGTIGVVGRATGMKLDAVGKIDVRDNVFIGYGAVVLPGVTIGPNAVIGAGTIVRRDVPPNSVVAGNPARYICSWDELVEKLRLRTESYPWAELIEQREGDFDPAIEDQLVEMRQSYFYPAEQMACATGA